MIRDREELVEPVIQPGIKPDRCPWATTELSIRYHDEEWGVPVHDDRLLFEFLVLEGAQAGLSWNTILQKRPAFRKAFANFEPVTVAGFTARHLTKLLANPGIIRNRAKLRSAIANAQAFLKVQEEFGSFDAYLWPFVGGRPIHNRWRNPQDIPTRTSRSDALANDLKRRGFSFVGSTICYAFMQAIGMVNDHLVTCFRYAHLTPRR